MSAFRGEADGNQPPSERPLVANSGHWRRFNSNRTLAPRCRWGEPSTASNSVEDLVSCCLTAELGTDKLLAANATIEVPFANVEIQYVSFLLVGPLILTSIPAIECAIRRIS